MNRTSSPLARVAGLPTTTALISPDALPAALVRRLAEGRSLVFSHVDAQDFLRAMLLSLSLDTSEKRRVLNAMPTLSSMQVEGLLEVFEDERREFTQLVPTEFDAIARSQIKALHSLFELAQEEIDAPYALWDAWLRRILRHAARRGFRTWLDALPQDWWVQAGAAADSFRRLYPAGNVRWTLGCADGGAQGLSQAA